MIRQRKYNILKSVNIAEQTRSAITDGGIMRDEVSVANLAKLNGVSIATLNRFFKTVYGQTVRDCIAQTRLQFAIQKIRDDHSVTEAALSSGYVNVSSLAKALRIRKMPTASQIKRLSQKDYQKLVKKFLQRGRAKIDFLGYKEIDDLKLFGVCTKASPAATWMKYYSKNGAERAPATMFGVHIDDDNYFAGADKNFIGEHAECLQVDPGLYKVYRHTGPYTTIRSCIKNTLCKDKVKIQDGRHKFEIYYSDPKTTPDTQSITDILIPVEDRS